MADWCKLPIDLLYEIVMRFETIEDLVYFSAVCRLWNHFASTIKHEFNVKKTMPWLLLAETTEEENPDCLRKVFNPVRNKCYQLKLPETIRCRCWGSPYGWIVTFNYDMDLHLFNPLTKARMCLPPITYLPYKFGPHLSIRTHEHWGEGGAEMFMRSSFIRKAFVLKLAPDEDDFVVFVTYLFQWKRLAFARPGDESWTSIDQPGRTVIGDPRRRDKSNCVVDVVCRGDRIFILYEDVSLGYLNVSDLSDPRKLIVREYYNARDREFLSDPRNLGLKAMEYVPPTPGILNGFYKVLVDLYLVDSGRDIFMVVRDRRNRDVDEDALDYATFGFVVYQLDFAARKWSQVLDLGNLVIFVGNNSSMSVGVISAGCVKSNSIYFTDDASDYWGIITPSLAPTGGRDMGIFDLENGEVEEIMYSGSDKRSKDQTPLWFVPDISLRCRS